MVMLNQPETTMPSMPAQRPQLFKRHPSFGVNEGAVGRPPGGGDANRVAMLRKIMEKMTGTPIPMGGDAGGAEKPSLPMPMAPAGPAPAPPPGPPTANIPGQAPPAGGLAVGAPEPDADDQGGPLGGLKRRPGSA